MDSARRPLHSNPPLTQTSSDHADASKCTVSHENARAHAESENEPTGGHSDLPPRQLAAINMLFDGCTYAQVCSSLRINAATLYRWRHSAAFKDEIQRRYRQAKVARRPHGRPQPVTQARDRTQDLMARLDRQRDPRWDKLSLAIQNDAVPPPVQPNEPFWIRVLRDNRNAREDG